MSLKTEEIKKSLANLDQLQSQLEELNKSLQNRQLDDINFGVKTNIRNLKTWIEMLYKYNGKSKSNRKVTASRENGKKGGRPPKGISAMRKRVQLLQDELLPKLQDEMSRLLDEEEITKMAAEKTSYEIELQELNSKLEEYERSKSERK